MRQYRYIAPVVLLALLNIYLFWPGSLYFLNDDFIHIPLTDDNQLFQTNSVRPLHELLVKLDLLLWGKSATGFHITALVLHFVVTWQVYDLCKLVAEKWAGAAREAAQHAAFLAVILFLLYPQHSESIAWILGRTPVLSCIFLLFALRIFFSVWFSIAGYVLGALSFAAALFTYEQSILLPLLVVFAGLTGKSDNKSRQIMYAVVMAVVAFLYIITRKLITTELVGNYEGGNFINGQLGTLLSNFARLVVRLWANPSADMIVLISVAAAAMLLPAGWYFTKKRREGKAVLICVAAVFLFIIPVISLGISTRSFESGRYMYLPSVFLVMALGIWISGMAGGAKKYLVPFVLLCVYWGWGKIQASSDYKAASAYAENTTHKVVSHFSVSADTLHIDTLQQEIRGLPVFRLGFMQGMNWIDHSVDSNRIVIHHRVSR